MTAISNEIIASTSRMCISPLGLAPPAKKNCQIQIITRITAMRYNKLLIPKVFVAIAYKKPCHFTTFIGTFLLHPTADEGFKEILEHA